MQERMRWNGSNASNERVRGVCPSPKRTYVLLCDPKKDDEAMESLKGETTLRNRRHQI